MRAVLFSGHYFAGLIMLRCDTLLILLLLWKQDSVTSVRLVELRVPAHAALGGEALLGCEFDMEGSKLYSVKWYKGKSEFYRYVPRNNVSVRYFPTSGVYVDMARSSSNAVTLVNLTRESAGVYRCEVSGEAPQFATVSDNKNITIHVLPKTGPRVTGLNHQYKVGDFVSVNCSSAGSQPEAQLKWLINGREVARDQLRGPWLRESGDPLDTMETILQLRFTLMTTHFKDGVMELKCQATIAPLYQQEIIHNILQYPAPPRRVNVPKRENLSKVPPSEEKDFATLIEKPMTVMLLSICLHIAIL